MIDEEWNLLRPGTLMTLKHDYPLSAADSARIRCTATALGGTVGIDITHLAIGFIKTRLDDAHGPDIRKTYEVIGEPKDVAGAEQLALENKYQFQYWALGLVGGQPTEAIKKGADRGIDGTRNIHDDNSDKTKRILFSVKAAATSA